MTQYNLFSQIVKIWKCQVLPNWPLHKLAQYSHIKKNTIWCPWNVWHYRFAAQKEGFQQCDSEMLVSRTVGVTFTQREAGLNQCTHIMREALSSCPWDVLLSSWESRWWVAWKKTFDRLHEDDPGRFYAIIYANVRSTTLLLLFLQRLIWPSTEMHPFTLCVNSNVM